MGKRWTRPRALAVGVCAVGVLVIAACVGDDPTVTSSEDAGLEAASAGDGDGSGDSSRPGDDSSLLGDGGPSGPCNLAADFATPQPVLGLDAIGSVARFSEDELTAYFAYVADGGTQYLGQARRATLADRFGAQTLLPTAGEPFMGFHPSVSIDDKTLYFTASFTDGGEDIFVAQRLDADASFGAATPLPKIDSTSKEEEPFITFSGDLWFASDRSATKLHIYKAPHAGTSGFGPVVEPANVNASDPESDEYPLISNDGLTLYFSRSGPDTQAGGRDVWWTHRPDTASDFAPPATLPNVNTTDADRASWLSPDGCRLYIARGSAAILSMFVASKPPN